MYRLRGAQEGARQDGQETSSSLIDIVDVGAAARTEDYEIAAYEGLRRMAKAMGEDKAADLLDENLSRRRTLCARSEVATRLSNETAKVLLTGLSPHEA